MEVASSGASTHQQRDRNRQRLLTRPLRALPPARLCVPAARTDGDRGRREPGEQVPTAGSRIVNPRDMHFPGDAYRYPDSDGEQGLSAGR